MLHPDTRVMEVMHMKPVRNCRGKKEFLTGNLIFWQKTK